MSDLANHVTDQVVAEFDRLRESCGLIQIDDYAQIVLTGEDRKGWLQGQATNNLRSVDLGASSAFCLCQPTGQILCVCDLWSVPDRFLVSVPMASRAEFLRRVEEMVVLEHVEAVDVSADYRLMSVQGPRATAELTRMVSLPSLDAGIGTLGDVEVYILRSNRTGMGGWDIWIPIKAKKEIRKLTQAIEPVGPEAFDIARLEAGVPKVGIDYSEKTLPPELGQAFDARCVSYNKGCYTGQEVLMRIHSRGHANRSWVGLLAEARIAPGDLISHPHRKDAGVVTSYAFSPDYGHIAGASMRIEAAQERESVVVHTAQGDVNAEVRSMPILRL